jgi:hypothetical protein
MSRANYFETIAYVMEDGTLKAADNIQVTVYTLNTDSSRGPLATIYAGKTGGTEVSNPFLTSIAGLALFYANAGDYEIDFHDTNASPRIADITIGWSSAPGDLQESIVGFQTGDLKFSATNNDHGFWLKCDGRELSRTEIESALSLQPGDGQPLVDFLGTGGASKYGTAAGGKIKLPEARRLVPMLAGPGSDGLGFWTPRSLGQIGGVERVQLSSSESGTSVHAHSVNDPTHIHGGATGADGDHTHDTYAEWNGFTHNAFGEAALTSLEQVDPGPGTGRGKTSGGGTHSHGVLTFGAATGISIPNHAGAPAVSSHENMPPFICLGFAFLRI